MSIIIIIFRFHVGRLSACPGRIFGVAVALHAVEERGLHSPVVLNEVDFVVFVWFSVGISVLALDQDVLFFLVFG